jgi:hypothetical protein
MSVPSCNCFSKNIFSDYTQVPEDGSLTLLQLPQVVLERIGYWVVTNSTEMNAVRYAVRWGKVCVLTHFMSHHGEVGRIIREKHSAQMTVFAAEFSTMSSQSQFQILRELVEMGNWLFQVPFTEQEIASLDHLTSSMKSMIIRVMKGAGFFTNCIRWVQPDVYRQAYTAYVQRLSWLQNLPRLTDAYNDTLGLCLRHMLNFERGSLTLDNDQTAARLCLVSTLEEFKERIVFNQAAHKMKWVPLLTSLQQECRDVESTFLVDVQMDLGPAFFKRPLPELLFDGDIKDEVFTSINRVRQARFQQEGLQISVEAE